MKIGDINIYMKRNHSCRGSRVCKFCQKKMCEGVKYKDESVNYKQNDIFQLENEEMSCDNVDVNYHKLPEFYGKKNAIDVKLKFNSYTTLIPLPLPDEIKGRGVRVYVTELNADFSWDDITPFSIQDPVWVSYDVDRYQVRLDMPLLSNAEDLHFRHIFYIQFLKSVAWLAMLNLQVPWSDHLTASAQP